VTTVDDLTARGRITPTEAAETAQALGRELPPSLAAAFGPSFIRSSGLYDEFIDRLALRVVRASGLEAAARDAGHPEELAARARLEPQRALRSIEWMLRRLAARGIVESSAAGEGPRRFRLCGAPPDLDPAPVHDLQRRVDPSWLPSYALAATVAHDYAQFLRGERTGEEILFSPSRLRLWADFFSNENSHYAVTNLVGAAAVEEWWSPRPAIILELGGGLGSAATALLQRLRSSPHWANVLEYRFTEFVPAFLRRGQHALQMRFPDASRLRFAPLDMNLRFAEQGVAPASLSLVYAVNTLHVARDLDFTLREVFDALAPGGQLVISECVRHSAGQTIAVEFIFNLMQTFRSPILQSTYRPNGGFLTPAQWGAAMEAARFRDVKVLPDFERVAARFPDFCVAAIGATRP
jgi:SAM-dependent methyltransferase